MVKAIGVPWDVVPLHWPSSPSDDGVVAPQALITAHHTIVAKRAPGLRMDLFYGLYSMAQGFGINSCSKSLTA